MRNLCDTYQIFETTLWLLTPNKVTFDNLVSLLLNEQQSRSNKKNLEFDESMATSPSFRRGRSTPWPRPLDPLEKEDKSTKKKSCSYCKKIGHSIYECTKHIASEKNKLFASASTSSATNEASLGKKVTTLAISSSSPTKMFSFDALAFNDCYIFMCSLVYIIFKMYIKGRFFMPDDASWSLVHIDPHSCLC